MALPSAFKLFEITSNYCDLFWKTSKWFVYEIEYRKLNFGAG